MKIWWEDKKRARQTEAIVYMWIKRHDKEQNIILIPKTINDRKRKTRQDYKNLAWIQSWNKSAREIQNDKWKNTIRLKNRKHIKHLSSSSWTNYKKRNKFPMTAETVTVGGRIYPQELLLADILWYK